jgi:hypothetical protein
MPDQILDLLLHRPTLPTEGRCWCSSRRWRAGCRRAAYLKSVGAEHVRSVANQRSDPLGPPGAQPLAELSSVGACVAGPEQRHLDLVVSDLGYDRVDAARQVRHQVGEQIRIFNSDFHCRSGVGLRDAAFTSLAAAIPRRSLGRTLRARSPGFSRSFGWGSPALGPVSPMVDGGFSRNAPMCGGQTKVDSASLFLSSRVALRAGVSRDGVCAALA